MLASLLLLSLPFSTQALFVRRDDATDGGGDPNSDGNGNSLTNWVGKPGQGPIEPAKDTFYSRVPSNLTKYENGNIISKRAISVSGTYQGVDSAYQVRIRTEDAHDAPALSLASIILPRPERSNGNVIVFQIPEEAIYVDCAPTYQLFSRNAVPEIQSLISEGFTVVVPDYEGQRGSFTVGKLAGKQVLDAARAALTVPGVKSSNGTTDIGLWGYGTAAFATGWAAEIATEYAPELPLKAAALGGYITDLQDWINTLNNSPGASLVVTSLLGMATEYKDVSDAIADNLVPHRRSEFEGAAGRCAGSNVLHFFDTNVTSEYFTPGIDIFSIPKVQNVYELNKLGKAAPKTNVFIYQGTADGEASLGSVRNIVKSYCQNGTSVKYREISGASHAQARNQYEDVIDYLNTVLSNVIPESSCQRIKNGVYA